MSEPTDLHRCEKCGYPIDNEHDFCLVCGQPVTEEGRSLKREDMLGCAIFVFLTFGLLFLAAGLSAVFLSTRSDEFADPNLAKFYYPGWLLVALSAGCFIALGRALLLSQRNRRHKSLDEPQP